MSGDLTKLLSETMAKLIEHTDAVLIIVVKDGNVGSFIRGPLELCMPLYDELGNRIVLAVSKAADRRRTGDACGDPTCPMHEEPVSQQLKGASDASATCQKRERGTV